MKRALAFILVTLNLAAADKPKDIQPPKFSSKTELVLVTATVTDKKGEPVHGLTAEDFQILEKNVGQPIKVFEEVNTAPQHATYAPTASIAEFTNQIEPGKPTSKPRRLTIIAFDMINTPPLKQTAARDSILKVISEAADKLEPTAIYTLGRKGVAVISDFSTDPQVLGAALKALKMGYKISELRGIEGSAHDGPGTLGPTDHDTPTTQISYTDPSKGTNGAALLLSLDRLETELELNLTSMERRFAAIYTLNAMQQIAQACSAIPGRKSLIWVSGGMPFDISPTDMSLNPGAATPFPAGRSDWTDVLPLYLRTWRALSDAQVAVYPIDVRGVVDVETASPSLRYFGRLGPDTLRFENAQIIETDNAIADATGGKAFYNDNGIKEGFEAAIKDSSSYYVIGYYLKPDAKTKPGWHPISLKSTRSGLTIRARSGYFYNPTPGDLDKTRQQDLTTALHSPIDLTAVGLTARWKEASPGQNGNKHVAFELVMPANFAYVDDTDKNHMLLDVVALAKASDGKVIGEPISRSINTQLSDPQVQQVRERGFTYANALDLPPGQYQVRFVVRDGLNGHTGTVTAPLKVE